MKPKIIYNDRVFNFKSQLWGEYCSPNKIYIYKTTCNLNNVNIKNVLIHEYTHYLIDNIKLLKWLFNKFNTYIIKKYPKMSVDFIYGKLPEEKFCNWVAEKFCNKYNEIL